MLPRAQRCSPADSRPPCFGPFGRRRGAGRRGSRRCPCRCRTRRGGLTVHIQFHGCRRWSVGWCCCRRRSRTAGCRRQQRPRPSMRCSSRRCFRPFCPASTPWPSPASRRAVAPCCFAAARVSFRDRDRRRSWPRLFFPRSMSCSRRLYLIRCGVGRWPCPRFPSLLHLGTSVCRPTM